MSNFTYDIKKWVKSSRQASLITLVVVVIALLVSLKASLHSSCHRYDKVMVTGKKNAFYFFGAEGVGSKDNIIMGNLPLFGSDPPTVKAYFVQRKSDRMPASALMLVFD